MSGQLARGPQPDAYIGRWQGRGCPSAFVCAGRTGGIETTMRKGQLRTMQVGVCWLLQASAASPACASCERLRLSKGGPVSSIKSRNTICIDPHPAAVSALAALACRLSRGRQRRRFRQRPQASQDCAAPASALRCEPLPCACLTLLGAHAVPKAPWAGEAAWSAGGSSGRC